MKKFLSTTEAAKLLGMSRIAVFQKIKNGEIKAEKVGHRYIIDRDQIQIITDREVSASQKHLIEKAVQKTIKEYGEALKMLKDT